MRFFVPGGVVFRRAEAEGSAEVDHAGPGVEHGPGEFHGDFGRGGEEDQSDAGVLDGLPCRGDGGRSFRVSNGRAVGMVVAMLQQERFDARVMLQNSNEFRPAIAAMSDDADLERQVFDYSSL